MSSNKIMKMPFGRPKDKGGEEETAASVHKAYEARIDRFLDRMNAPKPRIGSRDKDLNTLFGFCKQALDDLRMAEFQRDQLVQKSNDLERDVGQLRRALDENRGWLRERDDQLRQSKEAYQQLQFNNDSLVRQHSKEKREMEKRFEEELSSQAISYTEEAEQVRRKHEQERIGFEGRKTELLGQLLEGQSENEGWTDDKLKHRFQQLQQLIKNTASPSQHPEFTIQEGSNIPGLVPAHFRGRAGPRSSQSLLRAAIWSILRNQFFSKPYGFGALGPGPAHAKLIEVYTAWRGLFEEGRRAPTDQELVTIMQKDRMANSWRSVTFQTINEAFSSPDASSSYAPLASLRAQNIQDATSRIRSTLLEISATSNRNLQPDVERDVQNMVAIAGEVAMQFGVHRAYLQLSLAREGAQIEIGPEFHHYHDGDYDRGARYTVDLVVAPGLLKTGDGGTDTVSKRSIVPCEIYPAGS